MKKIIALLLSALLFLSLFGCEKELEFSDCPPVCFYRDLDTFVAAWREGKTENGVDLSKIDTLVYPSLTTDEFVFSQVHISTNYYRYYFESKEPLETVSLGYAEGIEVNLGGDHNAFNEIVYRYGLIPQDGKAYYAERNEWYIDYGGRCLSIAFHESIIIDNFDEISNYLILEEISR